MTKGRNYDHEYKLMRCIGLIGGMSWESTAIYYRVINEEIRRRRGGLHSAELILRSVNCAEAVQYQVAGQWDRAADLLIGAALSLEFAGAQCVLICTNTMHKVADRVQSSLHVPLLHIADVTGAAVQRAEIRTVGLLGTRFTLEETFYTERLTRGRPFKVVLPDKPDRNRLHEIINGELCQGQQKTAAHADLCRMMAALKGRGAEGVILGCTELMLLVGPQDIDLPLFNTTELHAMAAVDWALAGMP